MKKSTIFWIIGLVVGGILVYTFARSYFNTRILNYNKIVDESMEKFYISDKSEDLDPISNLFSIYRGNDNKKVEVQDRTFAITKEWFDFINKKYICDDMNINTCKIKLQELRNVCNKIRNVLMYKVPDDNYTIIRFEDQKKIKQSCTEQEEEINKHIKSPSGTIGKNYHQTRIEKCHKVDRCDECKDGICNNCSYVNIEGNIESIRCKESERGSKL